VPTELHELAAKAGLNNPVVESVFPYRLVLRAG
jgi:hypothetical protein